MLRDCKTKVLCKWNQNGLTQYRNYTIILTILTFFKIDNNFMLEKYLTGTFIKIKLLIREHLVTQTGQALPTFRYYTKEIQLKIKS